MQRFLSKLFSIIFHPLLMPSLGVFLLFNSNSFVSLMPEEGRNFIYYLVGGCTLILPLLMIPFFIYGHIISNPEMENRDERKLPYFITLCFNYFAFYVLKKINVPDIILSFVLSCFISVFLSMLISLKSKISSHMVGTGGLAGLAIFLFFSGLLNSWYILMLLFFIPGLTGYARLRLNAHSPNQVYSGFFLGFITVIITLLFY